MQAAAAQFDRENPPPVPDPEEGWMMWVVGEECGLFYPGSEQPTLGRVKEAMYGRFVPYNDGEDGS